MLFIGLVGVDGKELSYYGYSRVRFNPNSGGDWDSYNFQPVPEDTILSEAYICFTETSPIKEYVGFSITQRITAGLCPTFCLKGKFDPHV